MHSTERQNMCSYWHYMAMLQENGRKYRLDGSVATSSTQTLKPNSLWTCSPTLCPFLFIKSVHEHLLALSYESVVCGRGINTFGKSVCHVRLQSDLGQYTRQLLQWTSPIVSLEVLHAVACFDKWQPFTVYLLSPPHITWLLWLLMLRLVALTHSVLISHSQHICQSIASSSLKAQCSHFYINIKSFMGSN